MSRRQRIRLARAVESWAVILPLYAVALGMAIVSRFPS